MQYYSTRSRTLCCSASEAIMNGLAPDGGLYLPAEIPSFPLNELPGMPADKLAARILGSFFDDFSEEELLQAVHGAYDTNFENGDNAPLKKVGDRYVLELWHGPTCAFKDVALTLLPRLLTLAVKKCGSSDEICILTATSGDTGSAALFGFSDVPGTRIAVFFPHGGVSPMQQKQMTSCPGKNTTVCAVKGNFDDAQTGVKNIFADMKTPEGIRLSSANSINIGRLVPQVVYYFRAYQQLIAAGCIRLGDKIDFTVPTGNFGDILAGYLAKKIGLPVGKLICASNSNNVLSDFFATGLYDRRREFFLTASPSMDILISSNLERLLTMKLGCEETAARMASLKKDGFYTIPEEVRKELAEEFDWGWSSEEETLSAIGDVFKQEKYLMDTHTAVAYAVSKRTDAARPMVVLSTASPYKFANNVLKALGEMPAEDEYATMEKLSRISGTPIPAPLASLKEVPVVHKNLCEKEEMFGFVESFLQKVL